MTENLGIILHANEYKWTSGTRLLSDVHTTKKLTRTSTYGAFTTTALLRPLKCKRALYDCELVVIAVALLVAGVSVAVAFHTVAVRSSICFVSVAFILHPVIASLHSKQTMLYLPPAQKHSTAVPSVCHRRALWLNRLNGPG